MEIKVTTITPKMAESIMSRNPQNRSIKNGNVSCLVRDMKSGSWQMNGDAIRIDTSGALIDGQHRLSACIKSGCSFDTILITGMDPSVRDTIDSGSRRSYGDRLAMRGVLNSNNVAACLRQMACCAYNAPTMSITSPEADRILAAHPGVLDCAISGVNSVRGLGGILSAVYYIGCITGRKEIADDFLKVWKTGMQTKENDPAHVAREYVLRRKTSFRGITVSQSKQVLCWSFNKFAAGGTAKKVSIKTPSIKIDGWSPSDLGL